MKKAYIFILVTLISCSGAFAQQNLRSGYFLDGYTYRYKLNPAFHSDNAFIAIPVIGNFGVNAESSLSLSNLLYPVNGRVVTFMHPSVSSSEALKGLRSDNVIGAGADLGILSAGFISGGAFHTIDFSLKADVASNLPKELFAFAKNGADNGRASYDISGLGADADARLELAYGYSRDIKENIHVGARVKVLAGLMNAKVSMDRMKMDLSGEKWTVSSEGEMATSGMMSFKTKGEAGTADDASQDSQMSFEPDFGGGFSSFGAAVDLGVSWDFCDYLTLSASVLDLGFMSWGNRVVARTPKSSWEFSGFDNIGADDGPSLSDQFDDMIDDLVDMVNFRQESKGGSSFESLAMTACVGLEARMPFYDKMTIGLLGTRRFNGDYSWTEGRLSANLRPIDWLSLTCGYGLSNYGSSLGLALNFIFPRLTFSLGTDSILSYMRVTPQFIPVNRLDTGISFSFCFNLGTKDKNQD